jgi:LL-diaminopimelate aminotransferase
VANLDFFKRVVAFARKNRILVCHDAAYTEMGFDGYRAPSFMQAEGAMEVGLEFHSLSKTFNMTGWRIGFAVGHREAVAGLGAIKSNVDSGVFQAVQIAGIRALRDDQTCIREMVETYTRRRDLLVNGLKEAGFDLEAPKATFYVWLRIPEGYTSTQLAARWLEEGVVVTPGNGFGEPGEGYIRMALTQKRDRIAEAVKRIKAIKL